MSATSENRAATIFRAQLKARRLSIEAFLDLLADYGIVLSRDQFNNYLRPLTPPGQPAKRINGGFPQNIALIEAIVRVFAEYGPRQQRWGPHEALEFALAANQDPASLRQLAAIFPDREAFDAAYRTLVGSAGHPKAAAATELIGRLPPRTIPAHDHLRVPTYGALLPARIPLVGRNEMLNWLAHYCRKLAAPPLVVSGMPGLGKTALLSEFALRYGNYFLGGVFLLRADTLDLLQSELLSLGDQHFGLSAYGRQSDAFRLDYLRGALQTALPCLLIIDNIDTLRSEEIAALLPPSGACRILMTSRARPSYLAWQEYQLGAIERSASCELLARAIGLSLAETSPDLRMQLGQVAEALGDLPLALTLIGALLHAKRSDLPAALAALRHTLSTQPPSDAHDSQLGERLLGHVLAQLDPAHTPHATPGRELLALAMLFPPGEPIPRETLIALATTSGATAEGVWQPIPHLETTLNLLSDLAILNHQRGGFYSLHRLVRSYLREHLPLRPALLRSADWLSGIITADPSEPVEAIHPHNTLLRSLAEDGLAHQIGRAAELANILALYELRCTRFAEACAWAEAGLHAAETQHGDKHRVTAEAWCRLGLAHMLASHHRESIAALTRAVELNTRIYQPDHPEHLVGMSNLAQILVIDNRPIESRRILRHMIRQVKRMLSASPESAWLRERLARGLRILAQGRGDTGFPRQSLAYFCQARRWIDEQHPTAAMLDGEIAIQLLHTGDYARAEALFRAADARFRTLYETLIDDDGVLWHLQGAMTLWGLAWLALLREEWDDAEVLLAQAGEILTRTTGRANLEYWFIWSLRSELALRTGRYHDAEANLSQLEATAQRIFQRPFPFIALSCLLRRARIALLRNDERSAEGYLTTIIAAIDAGHYPNRLYRYLAETLQIAIWRRRGESSFAAARWAWLQPRLAHRLGQSNPLLRELAAQGPLPLIDPATFFFGLSTGS